MISNLISYYRQYQTPYPNYYENQSYEDFHFRRAQFERAYQRNDRYEEYLYAQQRMYQNDSHYYASLVKQSINQKLYSSPPTAAPIAETPKLEEKKPEPQQKNETLAQDIKAKIHKKATPSKEIVSLSLSSLLNESPRDWIDTSGLPENAKRKIKSIFNCKIKKFTSEQKEEAVERYKYKKTKRTNSTHIRYKVRQKLAGQRIRFKGKFVKHQRIDLQKAADILAQGYFIRSHSQK
jgi:hypothetical protein